MTIGSPWGSHRQRSFWLQGDGDLGARLERVLRRALTRAPKALAIGADSPGLPLRLIEAAHAALDAADAILGPCDDGGFYLLGLRRCPPGLLADLPWSLEGTHRATLARLRHRGLETIELDPWFDVDREEDLARLERLIAEGSVVAPATASAIARLRRAPEGDRPPA